MEMLTAHLPYPEKSTSSCQLSSTSPQTLLVFQCHTPLELGIHPPQP